MLQDFWSCVTLKLPTELSFPQVERTTVEIFIPMCLVLTDSWTLDHSKSRIIVLMNELQMVGPFDSEHLFVRYSMNLVLGCLVFRCPLYLFVFFETES